MPHITTDDGIRLFYEEEGAGTAIVFVHEFAGDHRSFEPQLRFFSRRYRVVAYNARGYPPSDVPATLERYSQDRARDDIKAMLDGLRIDKAHIVGISMGSYAALHFGLAYPSRALSLVLGGCGHGSTTDAAARAQFQKDAEATAASLDAHGMAPFAASYAVAPSRVQFQNKDRRGWAEFAHQLAQHSAVGSAMTLRGVQGRRPSLYEIAPAMASLTVPVLVATGDEDWQCLEPALFLKRSIPSAAVAMLPNTGHTLNIEEPALFNVVCDDFFHQVESGRWPKRDPRALNVRSFGGR
ncbi:MAG TPA: alpha/beta hydrolase [Stellaceae bacterium]|nr:alpha/beta hydrolase [Stellaceae bacterium]